MGIDSRPIHHDSNQRDPSQKEIVPKFRNFEIPSETDFVLVMTDYINHAVMRKVKRAAKDSDVSVIYARRSWSAIYKKLERRAIVN